MSRVKDLRKFGQSPWYDNIERGLLLSGGLKKLIEEDGISGVTSNPSIFEKAINGSKEYDTDIAKFARDKKDTQAIYDELTMWDVAKAADILRNVYTASKKLDGFVSIEVSPHLAHDAAATVAEAKRLFTRIGRENIMIKVPATASGISAIRQLIAAGINVNATLIFSQAHYMSTAQAYLEGLGERIKSGLPLDRIHSVASFFVSRIDTYVDKLLNAKLLEERNEEKREELKSLIGKAAVAQSKVIYSHYRAVFEGEKFAKLKEKGANVQRLLFGSTSTKNLAYSDVKYVEEIIGEGTVNTLPHATVEAFRDHGAAKPTIDKGLDKAAKALVQLERLGINVEKICQQIQDDGVQAFIDSYDKLIASLENKRRQFASPDQAQVKSFL